MSSACPPYKEDSLCNSSGYIVEADVLPHEPSWRFWGIFWVGTVSVDDSWRHRT